jgi:dienelactone hydrolase
VVARPPSSVYLLQKLIRRHRVSFAAASLVVGVVVIGAIATAMQATRALRAERLQHELREAARDAQANEAAALRTLEEEHHRNEKIRWARETLLPGIERLIKKDDTGGAFDLAVEAEKHIPEDPALTGLWPQIAVTVNIETTPPGADVYLKPYRKPVDEWRHIGKSPLNNVRVARDFYRWQIRKDGYATQEILDGPQFGLIMHPERLKFSLRATGSVPPGMVPVQGATTEPLLTRLPSVQLQDYWIDKYEVTNREYKAFVEKGAYSTEALWNHPFVRGETVLTWSEAMALFQDTTDQPGPATWRNGTYLEGEADYPVTGVSWFEAAAYAQFVGKRLPSIHHWRHAAGTFQAAAVIPLSNFSRRGLARVGQYQGMSAYGAYDMAGNAKEWCWNEADGRKRFILGGGWSEPGYMFTSLDALQPFDRSSGNGFRCMKPTLTTAIAAAVDEPRIPVRRTYAMETPVGDEDFQLFRRLYSYERTDLAAKVEAVDETDPRWRREKISFTAGYNNERMSAFLYLPKGASAPYQTIVYFPTTGPLGERSSDVLWDVALFEHLVEAGRALIYPIYKGTYERKPRPAEFEWRTQLSKDLGRAIDYLETRKDIQIDKLSYLGISWGAIHGAWLPAIESRLKANVLIGGGFLDAKSDPEMDNINFAPRVTIPTLMLNGRYDFIRPLETSQLPLLRWLGTPLEHKRHVLYDTGHDVPLHQGSEEIIAWLDRYFGHVK